MRITENSQWSLNEDGIGLLARALVLRKRRLIGTLWADGDRVWISASEYDPHGSRVRVSMQTLRSMVEEGELVMKKPVQRERDSGREKISIAV